MNNNTAAHLFTDITLPTFDIVTTGIILFVSLPLAAVAGFWFGAVVRQKLIQNKGQIDPVVGEATLSALLAILGLILAFTYGHSLAQADENEAALVGEAAALGTVFNRADFLPEPARAELQFAILEYTKSRIPPENYSLNTLEKVHRFLNVSLEKQSVLWPLMMESFGNDTTIVKKVFVASAMSEALDAHLHRVKALSLPVSNSAQAMMLVAAIVTLFLLGNRAGIIGRRLTWRIFVLSAYLSALMLAIVDTQRGEEGFIRIDDSTLKATVWEMEQALKERV